MPKKALETLDTIEYFMGLNPKYAKEMLQKHSELKAQLPLQEQIRWDRIGGNVANSLNDLALYETFLKSYHQLLSKDISSKSIGDFYQHLGHYAVKHGAIEQSLEAYRCSISHYTKDVEWLGALYSLSNSLQVKGEYARSTFIMEHLHRFVYRRELNGWKGATNNAMGVLSLESSNFNVAIKYFRAATDFYQSVGQLKGEYNAGTNLLLAFALSEKWDMYDRLYNRMKRMKEKYQDTDREIYLMFVDRLHSLDSNSVTEEEQQELIAKLNIVESELLRTPIVKIIMPKLGIEIPAQKTKADIEWVSTILKDKACTSPLSNDALEHYIKAL